MRVIQCDDERDVLERLSVSASPTTSSPSAARRVEGAAIAPRPPGLFDITLLGGDGGDGKTTRDAVKPATVGMEGKEAGTRSPAERLDLALDK